MQIGCFQIMIMRVMVIAMFAVTMMILKQQRADQINQKTVDNGCSSVYVVATTLIQQHFKWAE